MKKQILLTVGAACGLLSVLVQPAPAQSPPLWAECYQICSADDNRCVERRRTACRAMDEEKRQQEEQTQRDIGESDIGEIERRRTMRGEQARSEQRIRQYTNWHWQ